MDRNAHNINDLSNAPAAGRANWLPARLFADLDELRDKHVGLLRLMKENSDAHFEVIRRYEQEDRDYEVATKAQIDDPSVELPEITTKEDRARTREPMQRRAQALSQQFTDLVVDIMTTIEAKADEWLAEVEGQEAGFIRDTEELLAQVAEHESEIRSLRQIRDWILRASGRGRRAWVGRLRVVSYEECTGENGRRWHELKRMLAESLADDQALAEIDQERDELEEELTDAAA